MTLIGALAGLVLLSEQYQEVEVCFPEITGRIIGTHSAVFQEICEKQLMHIDYLHEELKRCEQIGNNSYFCSYNAKRII